jgi:succinate-acetate transporter protein
MSILETTIGNVALDVLARAADHDPMGVDRLPAVAREPLGFRHVRRRIIRQVLRSHAGTARGRRQCSKATVPLIQRKEQAMSVMTNRPGEPYEGVSVPEANGAVTPARRIADAAPLGLAAFALTTFVLSFFNAGIVSSAGEPVVLGLALAYGGLSQLLAGMWELRNGNTFGGTAFTSFGAFWLSLAAFDQFFSGSVPASARGAALGVYLVAWAIFTTYMWIASFRTSVATNVVFLLLAITLALLGIGQWAGVHALVTAGGWAGIATAVAAWYASFAGVLNSTFGRTVLPMRTLSR